MNENTLMAYIIVFSFLFCAVTCSGPKLVEAWRKPDYERARAEGNIRLIEAAARAAQPIQQP